MNLPEDLFTHKDTWREAIQIVLATTFGDNKTYWLHELKVFDKTWEVLEAMNQPIDFTAALEHFKKSTKNLHGIARYARGKCNICTANSIYPTLDTL